MAKYYWRVHTPNLLRELLSNNGAEALTRPVQIFSSLLLQVAARAIELNDPKLNALMCRLALYTIADPQSPDYNPDIANKVMEENWKDSPLD